MNKLFIPLAALLFLSSCTIIESIGLTNRKVKESLEVKAEVVPPVIIESFYKKFPGIEAQEWYKINEFLYAVRYKKKGKDTYVYFASSGYIVENEDYYLYDNDYDDYYPMEGFDNDYIDVY